MSYVTLAEFKEWISSGGDIDTADDTALQMVLDATTRAIDQKCGRTFTRQTAVTRTFYPNAEGRIDVTDLILATSIASDSTGDRSYSMTLASTDYELLPYTDERGQPSVRYQEVRIWPTASRTFTPARLVRIVGDFGYVDTGDVTPADVKQACLILAARTWKRREMPTGTVTVPDIGTVERIGRTDPDVEALLAPYVRRTAWVVV